MTRPRPHRVLLTRTRARVACALAALLVGACGDAPVPTARHVHLTPRAQLADGSLVAASEAIARAEVRHTRGVVDTTIEAAPGTSNIPWNDQPPPFHPWTFEGEREHLALTRHDSLTARPGAALTLGLDVPAGTPPFTAVELDLAFAGGTTARVVLELADDTRRIVEHWVPERSGRAPLFLDLGAATRAEDIVRLRVEPAADPPRALELFAVTLVDRATPPASLVVTPGADPAGDASDPAYGALGWLHVGAGLTPERMQAEPIANGARTRGVKRLVWPQLADVPLTAPVDLDAVEGLWSVSARAWPPPGSSGALGDVVLRLRDSATGALVHEVRAALRPGSTELSIEVDASAGGLTGRRAELAYVPEKGRGITDAATNGATGTTGALNPPQGTGSMETTDASDQHVSPKPSGHVPPVRTVYWEAPRLQPSAPDARPAKRRPNVVLITLDTTRADFAAVPAIAPNLHALANVTFTNAYSVSNTTTPSHASLLTGRMPHEHGAIAVGKYVLPEAEDTLAEVLRAAGYRTASFTNVEHIDAAHGFAQGFDLVFEGGEPGSLDGLLATLAAEEFLSDTRAPFFVWLHLFDPHTPYLRPHELPALERFHPKAAHAAAGPLPKLPEDAPLPELGAPRKARADSNAPASTAATVDASNTTDELASAPNAIPDWARNQVHMQTVGPDEDRSDVARRYAEGVHYADALVGRFAAALDAAGELDDTLIAITADHGESLGEAGVWANHAGLFPKNLHVPLALHVPAALDFPDLTPAELAAPVAAHDLFPTLLELLALRTDAPTGDAPHTLLAPDPNRILWFESDRLTQAARLESGQLVITTLRDTRLYNQADPEVLVPGTPEATVAFDVAADPRGEHDLFQGPLTAAERKALLDHATAAARQVLTGTDPKDLERALSPAEQARLEALGYL